jgi:uncharacterized protein
MTDQKTLVITKYLANDSEEIVMGVSSDQTFGALSLIPRLPDRHFHEREILSFLEEKRIVHGIDSQRIAELVDQVNSSRKGVQDELIAVGTPPIQPRDARVEYHFKTDKSLELKQDERGQIDFKELGLINNVEKGQLLATKYPAKEGTPGTDIFGDIVGVHAAKDTNFATGKNVSISEDGLTCIATREGQVFLKSRILNVSPIYTVAHDVDLNTGNISFNGTIVVHGNVLSGFTLKARENITVKGVVEGATLIAGGNIYIREGIKGRGTGRVQCKGELVTSFIESGNIECHGNMQVQTSIINSNVICYSKVILGGRKGVIVGGSVLGARGIECVETGSRLGVSTEVIVGDKPLVRKKIQFISREMAYLQNLLDKLNQGIKLHRKLFENLDSLAPEKRKAVLEIKEKRTGLEKEILELTTKRDKLQGLFKVKCAATLKVKNQVNANTSVIIGHSQLALKEAYQNVCFFENHDFQKVQFSTLITPAKS